MLDKEERDKNSLVSLFFYYSLNRKKEIEIIIKPYDINNKSFLDNSTHFSYD